jgi:hypothetical protein
MSRAVKTALKIYQDPTGPAVFSTARKLLKAIDFRDTKARNKPSNKCLAGVEAWLQTQLSYTLHRPVRKRFSRKPYVVTNLMDMWEADLMDAQNIAKHNDGVKYLLSVIDVFSRFLNLVPLKNKTGQSVTTSLLSILRDPRYNKPINRRLSSYVPTRAKSL